MQLNLHKLVVVATCACFLGLAGCTGKKAESSDRRYANNRVPGSQYQILVCESDYQACLRKELGYAESLSSDEYRRILQKDDLQCRVRFDKCYLDAGGTILQTK